LTLESQKPDISVDSPKAPRLFYGFVISIAAFFVLFSAYGVRFAYGVFFKPMAQELGFSAATTSAAYSISFFLEGVFSLVSGGLADRFGPRRVVSISSVLVCAGYCLMPLVHTVWQLFLFYGLIIGIGMGAMFVPLVSMTARWFNVRRNLMTGLVSSGAGAGMLIVPSSTAHLIDAYGWRTSFLVMGIFVVAIVFIAAQFMKRDPGEIGAVPYGESPKLPGGQSTPANGHSFQEALHIPQFWTIFVMMFLFGIFAMSYNVHIVPDAINSGMPSTEAAHILATTGALLIAGRILMGILADRIGNKRIFMLGFALAFCALLFISFVHTHWAFFVLATLIGIAQGGIGTSQSPIVASLFGLKSHGLILGCIGLGNTAGAAVGPLLTGYIFDLTKSYHIAFLICAASSLAALGFAGLIKRIDGSAPTHRL
jgi:MFS family permease